MLLMVPFFGIAQNQYSYGFGGVTADLATAGWVRTNQSTSASTTLWTISSYATTPTVTTTSNGNPFQTQTYAVGQTTPIPLGQDGAQNGFALVNFTSTSSTATSGATISNWLISPSVTVQNGDVVSFYTRLGKYSATNAASFADDLQLRMSTAATHINPSTGPADLGSFTNVLVDINPNFNLTSYPASGWTQFTYTITGLAAPTAVKFGFRYYVINGGANGSNSDLIGIDTFSVDRTLKTSDFFKNNFTVYPNPANDVINVSNLGNLEITKASITDVNGRIVKEVNSSFETINISELNAGVYFLKINTLEGSGTTKIVKN